MLLNTCIGHDVDHPPSRYSRFYVIVIRVLHNVTSGSKVKLVKARVCKFRGRGFNPRLYKLCRELVIKLVYGHLSPTSYLRE